MSARTVLGARNCEPCPGFYGEHGGGDNPALPTHVLLRRPKFSDCILHIARVAMSFGFSGILVIRILLECPGEEEGS